ncbi:hypothetical protein MAIC_57180 [Mycolicibacterium aichiense]|uniref:glycerol-3-phosphate dehydrogenase n=1 Tax=Mycolicibacterium aichiense TaxID=1799 RepID=A0AAD1HTH4_9MYCO|nr:hypothetical protein MAIC_57180 [Mycolicibacterium aichiense]
MVDLESNRQYMIRARQVINATGVWTDDTQTLANERGQFHVRSSKGIHLVVPRDRIRSSSGIILRTDKSVLFVIPWGRHWIIGTTDTDWSLDKAHPAASQRDIRYLLDQVNSVLRVPLTEADVEGVFAGLRPLLAGESADTSALSREHAVAHSVPGLVVIAGGKYTTYRVMARTRSTRPSTAWVRPSTAKSPSASPTTYHCSEPKASGRWNARTQLAAESGLNESRIARLLNRYGSMIGEVLALIRDDPSLGVPLPAADDYLRAEVVYGTTHEGALHLDDVLCRRTRISIETFDRGTESCSEVADLMAPVLGWSDEQKAREVAHYLARVAAERESQSMPDDETADGARLGAADIVPVG